jgi:hypothetical protein
MQKLINKNECLLFKIWTKYIKKKFNSFLLIFWHGNISYMYLLNNCKVNFLYWSSLIAYRIMDTNCHSNCLSNCDSNCVVCHLFLDCENNIACWQPFPWLWEQYSLLATNKYVHNVESFFFLMSFTICDNN